MFMFFRKMLTGMIEPTSGTASILGHDIRSDWSSAQKLIGLCPQQSILYDSLTPEEHLTFYGSLKGNLKGQLLREDVQR
jgi:ATP-binding cassette subfamily A (ABC1) protein 2